VQPACQQTPLPNSFALFEFNLRDPAARRRKLDEKRVLDVREYVKTIDDRLDDEIKVRYSLFAPCLPAASSSFVPPPADAT
jgi:hypothetical protein